MLQNLTCRRSSRISGSRLSAICMESSNAESKDGSLWGETCRLRNSLKSKLNKRSDTEGRLAHLLHWQDICYCYFSQVHEKHRTMLPLQYACEPAREECEACKACKSNQTHTRQNLYRFLFRQSLKRLWKTVFYRF